MKERPILFSGPMVRAILAGTKTQTRRVVKPQPRRVDGGVPFGDGPAWAHAESGSAMMRCPYGKRGDRLWVRETFGHFERNDALKPGDTIYYRADGECLELQPWRPSIHMPRWASRITLEVTGVRVERLQDISEADAIAEGTRGGHGSIPGYNHNATPVEHYRSLWEFIKGPWEANPWVWVVEFRHLEVRS